MGAAGEPVCGARQDPCSMTTQIVHAVLAYFNVETRGKEDISLLKDEKDITHSSRQFTQYCVPTDTTFT